MVMVSDKYTQMFEVIKRISEMEHNSVEEVKKSRKEATKLVAEELGIDIRTVMDKFSKRKMGISGVNHFDQLVFEFLNKINRELVQISINACNKSEDYLAIDSFFVEF
jgi:hypothetical protein